MKNIRFNLFIAIGVVAFFSSKESQAQFANGDRLLHLGVGTLTHYSGGIPVSITYEQQALAPNLSIGGTAGYFSHSSVINSGTYGYSIFLFGVRGSYHFNELLSKAANFDVKNLDLYAGTGLAYQSITWSSNSPVAKSSLYNTPLRFLLYIGAKYYFTQHVGVFLEVGDVGISTFQMGVAFKF